jgi:hypothetical protein
MCHEKLITHDASEKLMLHPDSQIILMAVGGHHPDLSG